MGLAVGIIGLYVLAVRDLTKAFTRMRYDGFRPDMPPPKRKLLPPLELPRED